MKSSKIFLLRLLALLLVLAFMNAAVMQTAEGAIRLEPVLQGLSSPLYVTNAHDGTNRLFVVEQAGRIKVLPPGATAPRCFSISRPRCSPAASAACWGSPFIPNSDDQFPVFRQLHAPARRRHGHRRISRLGGSQRRRDERDILLTIPQPYANHNGGMIEFGPDSYL